MKALGFQSLQARQLTRGRLQRWAGRLASALVAFMLPSSAAMKIIAHGTAAYGRVTRLSCVIREV